MSFSKDLASSLLVESLSPKRHVGVLVFKSVAILSDGYNLALVVLSLDFSYCQPPVFSSL